MVDERRRTVFPLPTVGAPRSNPLGPPGGSVEALLCRFSQGARAGSHDFREGPPPDLVPSAPVQDAVPAKERFVAREARRHVSRRSRGYGLRDVGEDVGDTAGRFCRRVLHDPLDELPSELGVPRFVHRDPSESVANGRARRVSERLRRFDRADRFADAPLEDGALGDIHGGPTFERAPDVERAWAEVEPGVTACERERVARMRNLVFHCGPGALEQRGRSTE
jgi:hypothetical protein